jgi:hypothetical protein
MEVTGERRDGRKKGVCEGKHNLYRQIMRIHQGTDTDMQTPSGYTHYTNQTQTMTLTTHTYTHLQRSPKPRLPALSRLHSVTSKVE